MYDGTVCHFSCNDGFIGSGSQERRCQRNGTWTGQNFGCQAVACPLPTNAVFLGCNTNATEMLKDSECRFSCKEGFEASNSTVRRCNKNGRWSGLELVCRGKPVSCKDLSRDYNAIAIYLSYNLQALHSDKQNEELAVLSPEVELTDIRTGKGTGKESLGDRQV